MAISKSLIAILVLALVASAEVIPFDNTAIEKIFQQKSPALLLFTSANEESKAARAEYDAYD